MYVCMYVLMQLQLLVLPAPFTCPSQVQYRMACSSMILARTCFLFSMGEYSLFALYRIIRQGDTLIASHMHTVCMYVVMHPQLCAEGSFLESVAIPCMYVYIFVCMYGHANYLDMFLCRCLHPSQYDRKSQQMRQHACLNTK